MINPTTELLLYPSASNPGDDTTVAGDVAGTTAVTGASSGEILPRMRALSTGTIDDSGSIQQQWQKAFFANLNTSSNLLNARIFLKNGLVRPSSGTGFIFIVLTNAVDAGKQVVMQEVVSGAIVTEAVNTPSAIGTGAATNGGGGRSWVERARLVDATSGATVTAAGDIQIYWGSTIGTATLLGIIPGASSNGNTWSWATAEVQLVGIASVTDPSVPTTESSTIANRRTAPSGTFTRATTYATGIVIRLDLANCTLGHGVKQPFWIQQTLHPGMPPSDAVQYCWRVEGDDDGA